MHFYLCHRRNGIAREIFIITTDSKAIRNFYLDDIFNLISSDQAISQINARNSPENLFIVLKSNETRLNNIKYGVQKRTKSYVGVLFQIDRNYTRKDFTKALQCRVRFQR